MPRYTPFLDEHGYTIKDDVPDHAANIIDTALAVISANIDWGTYKGKQRKPCHGQPLLLAGQPIGQYHCECCGMMVMAGMPHLPPGATDEQKAHPQYPLFDYEDEMGCLWPAGYEDVQPAIATAVALNVPDGSDR